MAICNTVKNVAAKFVKENTLPFAMYTAGMSSLNALSTAVANGVDDSYIGDVAHNMGGIASINALYTPLVTYGIKLGAKISPKYGATIAANVISLSVSAGFYLYACKTNDGDPYLASFVQGAVGLALTNYHARRTSGTDIVSKINCCEDDTKE